MEKMSYYSFVAAVISVAFALLLYVAYAVSGLRAARMQTAGPAFQGGPVGLVIGPGTATFGRYGSILGWLAFAFLTAWVVFRTIATGHGPFSNMFEFSVAFAWGILGAYYWFERSYHQRMLGLLALPIALALMLYAWIFVPATIEPLVPALQNNLLLTIHVAVAIVAYGSFSIAYAAATLFLIQQRPALRAFAVAWLVGLIALVIGAIKVGLLVGFLAGIVAGLAVAGVVYLMDGRRVGGGVAEASGSWGLPKPAVLDEIGYKAVVIGFPFLAATLVLGAIWADVAWGSYWSWDPKETASLVTWLIYATYLHARVIRGWTGNRAAVLLLVGFGATVMTYFGNYFFGGLHSYAGLG